MLVSLRSRLSALLFLEYFIRGAWQPLLGLYTGAEYLGFSGAQQAWVFNAFAICTLTGMFLGGQLADRMVSRRKFMAACHILGGLAIFGLAYIRSFWPFFGCMLLHCFFYVPSMSVANAIVFEHLDDAKRDFGSIRLWGSVGWVAAAWPLIFIPIDWAHVPSMAELGGFFPWLGRALATLKTGPAMETALAGTFVVSGIASLAQAALCLGGLPESPKPPTQGEPFAPLEAFKLLRRPVVLVLWIVTFMDSVIHYGYYFWTSRFLPAIGLPKNWIAPAMSIGQVMEIVTMIFLGRIIARLGWRNTLLLGILAQAVRFAVYAVGTRETLALVIGVNVMHGFAYACFFATVYIFVDEQFPKDIRTSAQGLFNIMMFGISQFVANFLWGWLRGVYATNQLVDGKMVEFIDYHRLFLVPLGMSLFTAVFLLIFFRSPQDKKTAPAEAAAEPVPLAAT